ncbi:unnamed protein product [Jaminaea pallidilutea]
MVRQVSFRVPRLPRGLRATLFLRCLTLLSLLFLINLILWVAALTVAPPSGPNSFASLCLIAWTTGLRHALDADHIAAIDNATRRMVSLPIEDEKTISGAEDDKQGTEGGADDTKVDHQDHDARIIDPTSIRCRRPITVGLFFSLGHSTIVVAVTLAISISISVAAHLDGVSAVGGIIGQAVSGSFLFVVAVINSIILARTLRRRQAAKKAARSHTRTQLSSQTQTSGDVEAVGNDRQDECEQQQHAEHTPRQQQHRTFGIITRLASPLLRIVTKPYHLYPIGLLFGLGFDTASTIALLSISAAAASRRPAAATATGDSVDINGDLSGSDAQAQASTWAGGDAKVVLLALLFTAGMTFVDSCDSVLMVYAYAAPEHEGGRGRQSRWALWERESTMQRNQVEQRAQEAEHTAVPELTVDGRRTHHSHEKTRADQAGDAEEHVSAEPHDSGETYVSKPLRNAEVLSILLTTLSIILAFVISIIVLLSLLAAQCSSCARSAALHDDPAGTEDGGLAGKWWSFWSRAGDANGYIGAGVVGVFLVILIVWCGVRWGRGQLKKSAKSKVEAVARSS